MNEVALTQRAQPWLGTLVSMRVEGDRALAEEAMARAFAEVAEIHQAMSAHDPASELSRLNRLEPGQSLALAPPLRRVLGAALALAQASGGLFDPTVGGLLAARGRLPEPGGRPADPAADWRDLTLERGSRARLRRRLVLDLGGIAKGYAVDRALARLRRPGIRAAIVNAGGDLRSFGTIHQVWVRDPDQPERCLPAVEIENAAVATSGGYFSESETATDLLDPRSGASLATTAGKGDLSVTVCARRAIWADALTKVVLADADAALPLLRRLGASALLLGKNGARRQLA